MLNVMTWALVLATATDSTGQVQTVTTLQGFDSEQACQEAQQVGREALPEGMPAPLMFCHPVAPGDAWLMQSHPENETPAMM